jgi:predicted transcriptional regulator
VRKPSSIRLPNELSDRVDNLAAALERPRSWVIERAIAVYLDDQEWQVAKIRAALDDVRAGTATFIPHDQVVAHLDAMIEQAVGPRPDHEQPEHDAADRVA